MWTLQSDGDKSDECRGCSRYGNFLAVNHFNKGCMGQCIVMVQSPLT
jgi:hypothetical protein